MVPTKTSSAMEEGSALSELHEVSPRAPSFSTLFYPHSQHLPHHPLPTPPIPTEQVLHATQTKDGSPTRSRNGYTHTPPVEKQSISFQVQPQSQSQGQVQQQQQFVFAAPILPQIATAPASQPQQPQSTAQLSIKTAKVPQKKQKEAPFERFVSQWRCSTVSKDANLKWSSFAPHSTKSRNRGVHISDEELPKTVPRLRQPLPRSQIQFQQQKTKPSSETSDKDSAFPPSSVSPRPSSSPRTALGANITSANTPNISLTSASGREGESTFGLAFQNTSTSVQNSKPLGDVFYNPQTGKWVTKENPAGFVFETVNEETEGGKDGGEEEDGMENNTSTRPLRTSSSPICPSASNAEADTETALAAMKRRASSPANSSGQQQQQQSQVHTFWKFQEHAFPPVAAPLSNNTTPASHVSLPLNNAPSHPEVRPPTPLSENSGPSPRSSSSSSYSVGDVDLSFMPESFSFAPSPAAHRPSPTLFTQLHPHANTSLNENEASRNLQSSENGSHRMALDSNIAPSFPSRSPSPSPSSLTFSTSSLAPSHPMQSFYHQDGHNQMNFGNQTMIHPSLHSQSQQLNIPLAYPHTHLPPGHPFSSLSLPTAISQPLPQLIPFNGMSMHFPDRQDVDSSSNTTTSFVPVQHSTPTTQSSSQPMSFTQHLSNHIQSMQQTDLQREPDFSQFQTQTSNNTHFGRPRSAAGAREMQNSFNHSEEGDEKMSERNNGSTSSTSTLEYIPLPLFEAVPRSASLTMIDHNTMSDLPLQFAPGSPSSLLMMGHQPMVSMTAGQSRPMMGPSPTPSPSFITSPIHSAGPLWTLTSPPLQVPAPPVAWHVPFEFQGQDPREGQTVLFSFHPDGSATPTALSHQFVGHQMPSHTLISTAIPPSFPYFLQQQQQSPQISVQQQQQQAQMHPHLAQPSQQQQQMMQQQQQQMVMQQQQDQAPVTLDQGEHLQYFVPFSNGVNQMHLH